ncbi:hypothetical protein [Ornithinibacillus sp. 179-J 7C1 HS]|uniref:hypothetical protein n=1 Tax=Ornithinibacillus sp. 179-J 7C1 HS TaxID=3142384 RepID=UPI0039A04A61
MFKFISVMLLLVICFLVGAIVGIDHTGQSIFSTEPNATTTEVVETSNEVKHTANENPNAPEVVNQQTITEELQATNSDHLSQKTASFIEVIVQGFYDVIVEILYQISQLFF